ncbi:MAG: hypothetical protein Q7U94_08130 [Sideroxyarcus sp.]|nr:hypothetical protein [Sideroxyarcus sp.]
MEIPPSAYVAVSAVVAATIAGGISFLVSVIAKDQKTSEFRQAWIDGLRDDIADMVSYFYVLSDMVRIKIREGKNPEEITAYLCEREEHFCKLEMVYARIRLRVNPNEHVGLINALAALREYFTSQQLLDSKAADTLVNELVNVSQQILKQEWKRVKQGEKIIVVTKWFSLSMLITALIIGTLLATEHLHIVFQ